MDHLYWKLKPQNGKARKAVLEEHINVTKKHKQDEQTSTELSSKERNALKKIRAKVLADYEEKRARLVAEAFGPVLDEILAPWPKLWSPILTTKPKFTRLTHPRPKYGIPADSKYQEPVDLKASLHNFRVYVNDTEYFMSNLPHVYAKWSSGKNLRVGGVHDIRKTSFDYKTEPYFAMICGAYIASHLSGISLLNLFDESAGNLISSFVRYHFYYQIRKFMQHPKLIHQYDVSGVKKYIPYKVVERESKGTDGDGNIFVYMTYIEHSSTDYRSFIAYQSEVSLI